jgi:hypothetical protein
MIWCFSEAANHLNEVMTKAFTSGPQAIWHGDQMVVVLSEVDYRRLSGEEVTPKSYLLNGPDPSDLDLRRGPAPMREFKW